jgi:caffeoyl-CoA O-methyltransferase
VNGITHEAIEDYLKRLVPQRDALLQRMEQEAQERDIPIIGPYAGRFLYALAKLARARSILEFGTAIGYSAIWFGQATAGWNGRVTTVEIDPQIAQEARSNIKEAGLSERIDVRLGDAVETVKMLAGPYDLVFIDGDKHQYVQLVELSLPKVASGGLILADNVLWSGRIVEKKPDDTTRAIIEFNQFISTHPQLETVIVPMRDGISVSIKKS